MATAVIMPKQGQSVESCILTAWYKETGDKVSEGDLLFAYETDKAAFEEEAKTDGILLDRFFKEGDEVPVLTNLAVIGKEGEAVDEFRPGNVKGSAGFPDQGREPAEEAGDLREIEPDMAEPSIGGYPGATTGPDPGTASEASVLKGHSGISPRAKRLAAEHRIVTDGITGSGPGGRIIERDVEEEIRKGKRLTPLARKKLEMEGLRVPDSGRKPFGRITASDLLEISGSTAGLAGDGEYTDEPLSNVRKLIAGAMHRSLQNSAQLTHHMGANATAMLNIRKKVKSKLARGFEYNITLNDMICYAVVRALLDYPEANAHYMDGVIRKFRNVHLGIAVDTDRGLLVPALRNAGNLSLTGLSERLRQLAESARQGKVSPDLLAPEAATFTVSNLGNYGVEMFTPVINLPQVGILGVNTIVQRPSVLPDGNFGFLPYIGLSLTYDHRALDGGPATLFLAGIRNQIESLTLKLLDT